MLQPQNNSALTSPLLPCFQSSESCHGPWKESMSGDSLFSVFFCFLCLLELAKLKFLGNIRRYRDHKNRGFCFIGKLVINCGHSCWKTPTPTVTFLVPQLLRPNDFLQRKAVLALLTVKIQLPFSNEEYLSNAAVYQKRNVTTTPATKPRTMVAQSS